MTAIQAIFKSRSFGPQARPYEALLLGVIAGAFASIFMKLSHQGGLPSLVVAAGRLLLAAIVLTPIVFSRYQTQLHQLNRADVKWALWAGFWVGLHFILLVLALEHTSILILMVIINTGPIWVGIMEVTFLHIRLDKVVWIGSFIALVGGIVIAVASFNEGNTPLETQEALLGGGLSLAGAISGSIYITIGRKVRAKVSLIPYVWIVFGFGGLTSVIAILVTSTPVLGHPLEGYFWLILLTIFPQLVGHSAFNYALGYLSATIVSLSSQLVMILTSIIAFFVFTEIPNPLELAGSVIICLGVIMAIFGTGHQEPNANPK